MYTTYPKQPPFYTASLAGPGNITKQHAPSTRQRGRDSMSSMHSKTTLSRREPSWDSAADEDMYRIHHHHPRGAPYYSTLVEPSMTLGEQWPPHGHNVIKGFQRVTYGQRPKILVREKNMATYKPLYALTTKLANTYAKLDTRYLYDAADVNPKRVLTKPSKPAKNDGYDNENHDYILRVNDILGDDKEYQYRVIDLLGQGTFGQVVKCERISNGQLYSVKVIKNKPAYRTQSRMEVEILKQLSQKLGPEHEDHILQLQHTFNHKNHLCLVFELLSFNLYELIKQNSYRGVSLNLVRVFALQLLDTLALLKSARIIHCDLKPENVLLKSVKSPSIKVIDFGSACHESSRIYTYIQSRFYRSPEVILGLQYTSAIDMWSLGCIVAELFIGIPLFAGSSEYNQLSRIVEMLGDPPQDMLEIGKGTKQFYNVDESSGKRVYTMKNREQYSKEQHKMELPGKRYFPQRTLPDLIMNYTPRPRSGTSSASATQLPPAPLDEQERQRDQQVRRALVDFLQGLLQLNPLNRWTPIQARYHPFITGEPFTEPYVPEVHMKAAMKLHQQQQQQQATTTTEMNEISGSQASSSSTSGGHADNHVQALEVAAKAATSKRSRAQSMGVPQAPSPIQELTTRQHRHRRSQGNLVGVLPPEAPAGVVTGGGTTSDSSSVEKHTVYANGVSGDPQQQAAVERKVKIAAQVKVRYGSRDSLCMPDQVHRGGKGGGGDDALLQQQRPAGRLSHAGEAAGGLLMMRQQEKASSSQGVAAAIKRRAIL